MQHRSEWRGEPADATRAEPAADRSRTHDISALREHERELERISGLYAALSQINQAIVRNTFRSADPGRERERLFNTVCRALVQHGGVRMAWVGWKDAHSPRLLPVASFGDDAGYLQRAEIHVDERPSGQGPAGICFRSGRDYVCDDVLTDPSTAPWRAAMAAAGFRGAATLPLRLGGQVAGVLAVYADRRGFFHAREEALLVEAALNVSFALDNHARDQARCEADRALREETLFSQTMLDSMPGVVYLYDASRRFLRWNRHFEVVTGCSAQQIAAMHPTAFFTAADQPRLAQRVAEAMTGAEVTVEAAFRCSDGSTRPYFFTGRRVEFRGQACLVAVGIDISERKRVEAALVESRSHLEDAQRIAGIGSWSADLRTGQRIWSEQTCRIFGVDQATRPRSFQALLRLVHPDDRHLVMAAHMAVMAGQTRQSVEYRIVLADGTEKVVHAMADVVRDADGQPVALAGTTHDITARVRLAAERESRHRAEAADRVKSAFLATMSHELRTPLNSIVGFTGILLRGLAGPLNAEQDKQLGMVRASARHLLALVNDVLDISKIEAGELEVAREPYDARRSLDKVVQLVAPHAQAKGLDLRVSMAPDLGMAWGDARRFEQILLNLLSNAIKFTEHGEVVLTAEVLPGSERFQVAVGDTGIGIRQQDQAGLFTPFRQLDAGLGRRHDGTGLGLAISRRLAELMGGEIGVESEYGRGSRFTVTLPLQPPGAP